MKHKLLTKHVCVEKIKRRIACFSSVTKSFATEEGHRFIANDIARGDRGNDGMNVDQEIELV